MKITSTDKRLEKKAILNNTAALIVMTVLNYILPFITLPYLSRVLDIDKLGLIFFAQVVMDYFYRFMMFGFDFSGVRNVAINRDTPPQLGILFNSILCVQVILLCFSFIILTVMICFIDKFHTDWIVYYFTFLSVIAQLLLFQWFYQGMERMKFITILNVITKTLALILIFIFVTKPQHYYMVPLFNSLGGIIAGIISIFLVTKKFGIKFSLPPVKEIWGQFQYSRQFFLSKICIALYRSTNAFVLGLSVSTTAVAYYVSADKIYWGAMALYVSFVNALFPFMSKNKDLKFFKKILTPAIILSIIMAIILFTGSKFMIVLFFTEKMQPAVYVLKILSLSFVFLFLADLLGFPFLGAFNYIKETNQGYMLGGIYNVAGLLILYLIHQINIYSVSILVSSTYFVIFLHRLYYIRKYKILSNGREKYD